MPQRVNERKHIRRISKQEARRLMGRFKREIDATCQLMKAEKVSVVSLCRPITGKSLWIIRANNGGFWYDMEV
jgi:hypothetical protein